MSLDDANDNNLMASELLNSMDIEESDIVKELSHTEADLDLGIQLFGPSTSSNDPTTFSCALGNEDSSNSFLMLDNSSLNEKCDNSDSDSDVIFIENKTEVIELSDEDSQEFGALLSDLDVPESVINSLKIASNKISLKLGEQIKNGGPINNIMVEVPTVVWELPWKIVTGLFRNPSVVKPARQPKQKKEPLKHPFKPKRKLAKALSATRAKILAKVEDPPQVKKEAELVEDSNRLITHFSDPNKPPEFFEISRFGRLIKKPTRLMDDVRILRQSRKPRNIESIVSKSTFNEADVEAQLDQCVVEFSKSSENSIDSEFCDRWILNSDADEEDIDVLSISSDLDTVKAPEYPSVEEVKNLLRKEKKLYSYGFEKLLDKERKDKGSDKKRKDKLSDKGSDKKRKANGIDKVSDKERKANGIDKVSDKERKANDKAMEHNMLERKRRDELRKLFNNLLAAIVTANPEFKELAVVKINVLRHALITIKKMENEIRQAKKNVFVLREKNSHLKRRTQSEPNNSESNE